MLSLDLSVVDAKVEIRSPEMREEEHIPRRIYLKLPSSSGAAPCYGSVGPADVKSKDMDTAEQAKAKRQHGCERPQEDVRRAKRMEHHEDDDGHILMELACTDDFEKHCDLTAESKREL